MTEQNSAPESIDPPPLPVEQQPRPFGFWASAIWVLLAIFATGLVDIMWTSSIGKVADWGEGAQVSITGTIGNVIAIIVLFAAVRLKGNWRFEDYIGLHVVPRRVLFLWILAIIAWGVIYDSILYLLGQPVVPDENKVLYISAPSKTLLFVLIVFAAPIGEEVIFRGFLYRGWLVSRLGAAGTVLLSSLIFAVLHLQYDLYGVAGAGMLGALIGMARISSGSIYPCIAMHMANNFIAFLYTMYEVSRDTISI